MPWYEFVLLLCGVYGVAPLLFIAVTHKLFLRCDKRRELRLKRRILKIQNDYRRRTR